MTQVHCAMCLFICNVKMYKYLKKNNMAKRDTYNYNLKKGNKIVYKGITSDLESRESAHRTSGKKFDKIQKVGRAKTQKNASKEESRQLAIYRKNHNGNNPRYNKTKNG